ncbi:MULTISPECIES: sulfatase-like hydrolase/transferase [Moorena]|uniref:Arylsulfatase A family enzyme n=1 Tax=Moorena producens 3L TaxID=489825 RepID=F4XN92_9CYAN|nr:MULTISPECIES: sulfatase-like hydrolase/transferase [Moorena]EGJ34151.1 arylsulfatase A family enzyme [Moorena producens 3L]OLT65111.1 hypothetical protein BI334_08745 [Moorena producens 3L]
MKYLRANRSKGSQKTAQIGKRLFNAVTAIVLTISFALVGFLPGTNQGIALADTQGKPNILVIMGDDIGWFNPSIYNRGIMGYQTPHIDRIAEDGILFTDFYGENSCTAGRSAFLTGQSPGRTGLTKVGLPGVDVGLQDDDPTLADLLGPLGYATGQFVDTPRRTKNGDSWIYDSSCYPLPEPGKVEDKSPRAFRSWIQVSVCPTVPFYMDRQILFII